jgi:hypothetical protein
VSGAGGVAQEVENLLCMQEAVRSNPSLTKKIKIKNSEWDEAELAKLGTPWC